MVKRPVLLVVIIVLLVIGTVVGLTSYGIHRKNQKILAKKNAERLDEFEKMQENLRDPERAAEAAFMMRQISFFVVLRVIDGEQYPDLPGLDIQTAVVDERGNLMINGQPYPLQKQVLKETKDTRLVPSDSEFNDLAIDFFAAYNKRLYDLVTRTVSSPGLPGQQQAPRQVPSYLPPITSGGLPPLGTQPAAPAQPAAPPAAAPATPE